MRINRVKLNHFKCHEKLEFDIAAKNCLIYGENGSGKSSVYWALYSVFKTHFRNPDFNYDVFKKRDSSEKIGVTITLDDQSELTVPSSEPPFIDLEKSKTIYFANQSLLDELTSSSGDNFYENVWLQFKKYFPSIESFDDQYQAINNSLTSDNHGEKALGKGTVDQAYKTFLEELIIQVNHVLEALGENFSVSISFTAGKLEPLAQSFFKNPILSLKINNVDHIQLHFNEAKLKMTAIAMFFSLIKMEENKNNTLKLLVLDDFLTSLDMANRHYIIEYLFKNFKKYQIILFTHNLHFYNLILDWLNLNHQAKHWDVKNMYLRMNNGFEESVIYDEESDYLKQAKDELFNGKLQPCGNFIRKEFERLIHEMEKKYQLGAKEECNTIVDRVKGNLPIYDNPSSLLDKVLDNIGHCKRLSYSAETNKGIELKKKLSEINITEIPNRGHLKAVLKNLVFYRKILMNQSSHDNPDAEVYRKEYENSILVIEQLRNLMDKQ
ncbi:MAG: hypothetical protein Q9M28_00620 [Mariprofundaceae bacterium]|nr:hypothetical protein [Mariprofundaceae bacterium]